MKKSHYDKNIDYNPFQYTRDKLDRSGMCCTQLDYIDWNTPQYDTDTFLSERLVEEEGIRNTVNSYMRPTRREEAARNPRSPPSSQTKPLGN